MAKQTITLHMYESIEPWNQGARGVLTFDFRGIPAGDGRVWLGQQDVEIDFPDVDTRQFQIDALEAQVKQERADSQVRVNLLLERISKLQAIGHEV